MQAADWASYTYHAVLKARSRPQGHILLFQGQTVNADQRDRESTGNIGTFASVRTENKSLEYMYADILMTYPLYNLSVLTYSGIHVQYSPIHVVGGLSEYLCSKLSLMLLNVLTFCFVKLLLVSAVYLNSSVFIILLLHSTSMWYSLLLFRYSIFEITVNGYNYWHRKFTKHIRHYGDKTRLLKHMVSLLVMYSLCFLITRRNEYLYYKSQCVIFVKQSIGNCK